MGQSESSCVQRKSPVSAAYAADVKRTIYSYYPGLEQQLEMAFSCHDLDSQGRLPYNVLEQILRHLLMQYGLIEYITRFVDDNGVMDTKHVAKELRNFGVSLSRVCCGSDLSCDHFKSLAVIWLKKILDTYADDQAEWAEKMREQQEEQSEAYMNAMKNFQEQFVLQQSLYQQGLEEQQKQISDWNKLLEDSQRTQQEVYDAECRRMDEIADREKNAAVDAVREKRQILQEYADKIIKMASEDKSGICFAYPSSSTPYGACVSAGAQEPTKRRREKRKHAKSSCRNVDGVDDENSARQKGIRGCC